jgi:hypothetical protein
MSNRDAALLGFKLLGLWLLSSAIIGVASMPYVWQSSPDGLRGFSVATLFLPSLVALGVGIPVWLSADSFARHVFPDAAVAPTSVARGAEYQTMFGLGAALIGLLLLTEGVPAIASAAYLFTRSLQTGVLGADPDRRSLLWDASAKANAVAGLTRLLLGLALLAGPARLSAALNRVRREFRTSLVEEGEGTPKR